MVALQLEREFQLNGVHLNKEQRNDILDIHSEIYQLSNIYMNNLDSSNVTFKVPVVKSKYFPKTLLNILKKDSNYIYLSDEVIIDSI